MIAWVLAATLLAAPPDLTSFEKILVPAVTTPGLKTITGANGSRFAGTAGAWSASPVQAWLGGDSIETIEGYRPLLFPDPSRAGRILYLERSHASDVALQALLHSSPDVVTTWHDTTLPVVREQNLRTGRSVILDVVSPYTYVPADGLLRQAIPQFRHHLRIYDADARGDAQVRVRRMDQNVGGVLIEELVLTLDRREGSDPTYPAFAEILIPELCHPFSAHTPCNGGAQWLEIEPLSAGLRYFPVVSATDNVTQQVTVQWPQ